MIEKSLHQPTFTSHQIILMVLALHLELEMPTVMPYGADLDHTPEQVCFENKNDKNNKQESVAGSVIQATGSVGF